jgi:ketosteroid isomerase-like protein
MFEEKGRDMPNKTDEAQLAQLYRDLCDASMRKDADAIREILSEDYVLEHMTGMRQTREEYISAVLDGTLNYFAVVHDSVTVEVDDDGQHASVRGRSRTMAAVFGGSRHIWRLQQDLKASKTGSTWKFDRSQASTY